MAAALPTIPKPAPLDTLLSRKGQCAVVTNGSRGLGEAIVHRLAEAGAAVVFTGRGADALRRVENEVVQTGATAVGVTAELSKTDDSRKVIDLAMEQFGTVDILVNNAALHTVSLSMETTEHLWDDITGTDLKGPFFTAQFAAKTMIAAGRGGRIINLLSVDAFKPRGILAAYASAKAGLWLRPRIWRKNWYRTDADHDDVAG